MDSTLRFDLTENFRPCMEVGILHSPSGRFLTAEVFNNEINVSGNSLRRRQIWTLLSERGRPEVVYLLSHLGRFLASDKDGKVTGSSVTPGSEERFVLDYAPDANGEVAIRSEAHGLYLTSGDVQISCFSKTPVWWAFRLAGHPQIHLRHVARSRYLRTIPNTEEVRADQPHPWGNESIFWLEQPPMNSGTIGARSPTPTVGRAAVARLGLFALRTEDGRFLDSDGSLPELMQDSTLWTLEIRSGHPKLYSFRAIHGNYLTTIGPGTVKVKQTNFTLGKDDLYQIERASLQVGLKAHNNKYVSVKQGSELSANQHEMDECAIFQLEYLGGRGFVHSDCNLVNPNTPNSLDDLQTSPCLVISNGQTSPIHCLVTGYWQLRSHSGKLLRMVSSASVRHDANDGDEASLLEVLAWPSVTADKQGQVALRINSKTSQLLSAKKLGAICSSRSPDNEDELPPPTDLFRFQIVNRPTVVFRSALTSGFLSRSKQTKLDCCSVMFERFHLKSTKQCTYQILTEDRKFYWTACSDGYIHLKPRDLSLGQSDIEEEDLSPGTEFLFHYLGNGPILISCLDDSSNGWNLIKSELKGEVKWDNASKIQIEHIWEI